MSRQCVVALRASHPVSCWLQASGYIGLYTAASAWYISFAELYNEVLFKGRVSYNT